MNRQAALLVAGLVAIVALASGAAAQSNVSTNVLGTEGPVSFSGAADTVIQQGQEQEANVRSSAASVALNGSDNGGPVADLEESDYLLGVSGQAGDGIPAEVADRYRHGTLLDASLDLSWDGGCNSPSGELTVRVIDTVTWSPFTIGWNDTQQSDANGSVDVDGKILRQVPVTTDTQNCQGLTLDLPIEDLKPVLTGDKGGIKVSWNGEQPLTLDTLDAGSNLQPALEIEMETNASTVYGLDTQDGFPAVVSTGEQFAAEINVTDDQPLPTDGVKLNITPTDDNEFSPVATAEPTAGTFIARQTFPLAAEGSYKIRAEVTDSDGWLTKREPAAAAPQVIVDDTEPRVDDARLADVNRSTQNENATGNVTVQQGDTVELAGNITDASCQGGADPCATWALEWQDVVLGQGNVTPSQEVTGNVTVPIAGNATARLVIEDAAGNRHTDTRWNLTAIDTRPPDLETLDASDLAPNLTTTIENGTDITLGVRVLDDSPVNATLLLDRATPSERDLPDPDENGEIETTLELSEGRYDPIVELSDTEHTVAVSMGRLSVVARDVPTVQIDKPGDRVGPDVAFDVHLRDENLQPVNTTVNALVNGVELTPDVQETSVDNGRDLTVSLQNLSHGDELTVRVRAVDTEGLEATASVTTTVDARAPELTAPDGTSWYASGSEVTFEATDPGQSPVSLTVNGPGGQAAGEAPLTVGISRLVSQPNRLATVSATLEDPVSNTNTATVEVGLDTARPQAQTGFNDEGFVVKARDNESGIHQVTARVQADNGTFEQRKADRLGPATYAVRGTQNLERGDEVTAIVTARDQVGQTRTLGSPDAPLELTVPDRPPELTLSRASATVGDSGVIQWNATDPDRDSITVDLTVEGPEGTVVDETIDAEGLETIRPNATGRYSVEMTATAAGERDEASTFFYLSSDGRIASTDDLQTSISPGSDLTFTLSFPTEPESVHVVAVDDANVSHSGKVDLQGTSATITFENLAEGSYNIESTVVYESGATERARIASVNAEEPLSSQLSSLVLPLLVVLALLGVAAIVYVWSKGREAEQEEGEQAPPEA
jgi:hypothetical protein